MEQPHQPDISESLRFYSSPLPIGWRLRDRLFPVLTMGIAFLWAFGAMRVAEYVGSMNTARAIGALMTAPMSSDSAMPSFPGGLFNMPPAQPAASQVQEHRRLTQQITTLEVVVYVWRAAMLVVAGLLAAFAILSVITGRFRLWHLLAAFFILVGTMGTMVGLRLLIKPEWGGMPPLPALSYFCTGAVQSAYAIILLTAFLRKPKMGRIMRISTFEYSNYSDR